MKKELKDIVKGILYSNVMSKPRFWYKKVKTKKNSKMLYEYTRIIESKQKKNTLKVAFVIKYPEMWNSSKSVFESLKKMENVELLIIAVQKNESDNPAYTFARKICDNVVSWESSSFDYSNLGIDYIFFTRPYDKDYPKGLKPRIVCKYSKICYIPYGFEFVTGYHIEVEYNFNFLPYVSMIFCEGESSYNYCRKLLPSDSCTNLYRMGFPCFDLLKQYKTSLDTYKTVLWTPRWSFENLSNDGTSFFEFLDPLFTLFNTEEMRDYNLVIRPHPLMFDNFIKNGVMTEEEMDNLKNKVASCNNISFDINCDYLETASHADLIISDFSGMLIEFLMLNKPIIYCGKSNSFDDIGMKMDLVMYHLDSDFDIIRAIKNYIIQGDTLKKQREVFIREIRGEDSTNIGTKIAKKIYVDYFGEK